MQTTLFMKSFGLIVIVLGIVMMLFTGFNLVTKKHVADVGPIEINRQEKTPIYWSPVAGGVLVAAGITLFIVGKRRN